MTDAKKLALGAARRLLAKLPLPIATPAELVRATGSPAPDPLARKRVVLLGRGAPDASTLGEQLTALGAVLTPAPASSGCDVALAVLPDKSGYEDLAGLHGALAETAKSLARGGRVIVVVRANRTPLVVDGVHGFVRSLGRELGRRGVTVNAVTGEDLRAAAPVVAFLTSDRASFVSGQTLHLSPGGCPAPEPGATVVAVVTGAARGIGASIARTLAAADYRVVLLDVAAQQDAGQALCDALGGEPAGMAFHACNVCDDAAVEKALERARTLSPSGTLDVLVNNAGITRDRTFTRMSDDEWGAVLAVNLSAVMHVTKAALPRMSDGARVVGVTSLTGLSGNFGQTNYAASKGGLIGYTRQLAREVESRGITVTAVAPGLIETAMSARIPLLNREIAKQMTSLAQAGQPEDVAMAVEFLARREAWPLRGQVLRVDGGMFFGP